MIIYDKLWKTMKQKDISQYKLINDYHVSAGQLSRLRSNPCKHPHARYAVQYFRM